MLAIVIAILIITVSGPFDSDIASTDSVHEPNVIAASLSPNNYDTFATGSYADTTLSRLNISVVMDESDASLNGTLLIDYYNAENIALDEIPFHLYPSGMYYDTRQGSILIENVVSLGASPNVTDTEVQSGQQLMWIHLDDSIDPGEFLTLNISFRTILPEGNDRSGVYGSDANQNRIYTFSGFYPIPCVYDKYDGWNTDPYIHAGDPFYFDMAYYDLQLDIPEGMVVAATGSPNEISHESGRSKYHYEISTPVREVTFSVSRYYETESTLFKGVNVTIYYLPVSASIWESDALEQATQALDLFNSTFGIYPYPTLNVVEQHAYYGGMEFPCQVYVTRIIAQQIQAGSRVSWYHELVIVHEVAHQWWSQIVGDDCVDWGFLDENLASWSHAYYGEYYYSDWEHFQMPTLLDNVRTFYATYQSGCIINRSNYVREDLVSFIDYIQGPLILEKLRMTIGNEEFLDGVRLFFQNRYLDIATLNDLQFAFETTSDMDLDWFFLPWYNNEFLPNYVITDALYNVPDSTLTFRIEDMNEEYNSYPYSQQIPVKIFDTLDNLIVDTLVWVNGTTDCTFQLESNPKAIHLDYEGYILVQLPDAETTAYVCTSIVTNYGNDIIIISISVVVIAVVLIVVLREFHRRRA